MINFEIKLSFQSCAILFGLIEWVKVRDAGIKIPKGKGRFEIEHELFCKLSYCGNKDFHHYVTHSRILVREGLVKCKPEQKLNECNITRKGYLMAEILQIEFAEAKQISVGRKRLK